MGDSEIDQIFKCFQNLGTPNEQHWPDALKYKDFKPTFPKWRPKHITQFAKGLDDTGFDLLEKLIGLDPKTRISARMAL